MISSVESGNVNFLCVLMIVMEKIFEVCLMWRRKSGYHRPFITHGMLIMSTNLVNVFRMKRIKLTSFQVPFKLISSYHLSKKVSLLKVNYAGLISNALVSSC